jgi:hypothetical protein
MGEWWLEVLRTGPGKIIVTGVGGAVTRGGAQGDPTPTQFNNQCNAVIMGGAGHV